MSKPTLCLDFDGVIHSYSSKWISEDFIPDPPVPGVFEFIYKAMQSFDVVIFSSRSKNDAGIRAMRLWMEHWVDRELENDDPDWRANHIKNNLINRNECFPSTKPSAFLTIDDRALTFDGTWPAIEALKAFKPWNKRTT